MIVYPPVFVDRSMDYGSWVPPRLVARLGTVWCHMFSYDVEALHEFAARIGMKRAWFQGPPKHKPHYDLVPTRRKLAVRLGAVELDYAEPRDSLVLINYYRTFNKKPLMTFGEYKKKWPKEKR